MKIGEQFIKSGRDRKSWGRAFSRRGWIQGRASPLGAGFFPAWGWSSSAVLPQRAGGGVWGGAAPVGGVREGPGRSPRPARSGRSSAPVPQAECKSQPWLPAAGAGGPGRHGLGPGRLPPGAPRVGAGHPWDWMGTRGGRPASAEWRGWSPTGAELEGVERGDGGETGGVHSQGQDGVGYGGGWEPGG